MTAAPGLTVVGVDPGVTGAIAWLRDGDLLWVEDMPAVDGRVDAASLAGMLTAFRPDDAPSIVVVEQVSAMPGQGVASMFKFGAAYGAVLGAVGALELPVRHVRPTVWKKAMRLGGGSESKEKARAQALDRWPHRHDWFRRKKDHGRAEAALLCQWYAQEVQS